MKYKIIVIAFIQIYQLHSTNFAFEPLTHRFLITPKVGIAPAIISEQGPIYIVRCADEVPLQLITVTPKTTDNFNVPWLVGIDLGWAASPHVEIYAEFNYRQTTSKDFPIEVTIAGEPTRVDNTLTDFKALSAYAGFRYYFDRVFCNKCAFFFGTKMGFVHYSTIRAMPVTLTVPSLNFSFSQNSDWFPKSFAPAGALQVGFDYHITDCFSLFGAFEILAATAPKTNVNIPSRDPLESLGVTNVVRGSNGTLTTFPVVFGLRFNVG